MALFPSLAGIGNWRWWMNQSINQFIKQTYLHFPFTKSYQGRNPKQQYFVLVRIKSHDNSFTYEEMQPEVTTNEEKIFEILRN